MDTFSNHPGTVKEFLTRHVTGIDIAASIIILVLVMSNVFFILKARELEIKLQNIDENILQEGVNDHVLEFTGLFIEQVLKAEAEIDFETRLRLESSVRALQDEQILAAWQAFTNSTTEREAQTAVKNLLGTLVAKIK